MKRLINIIIGLLLLLGLYSQTNAIMLQNEGAYIDIDFLSGDLTYYNKNSNGLISSGTVGIQQELLGYSNIYNCSIDSNNCEILLLYNDGLGNTDIYKLYFDNGNIVNLGNKTGLYNRLFVYNNNIYGSKQDNNGIYKFNFSDLNLIDTIIVGDNIEFPGVFLTGVFDDRLYFTKFDGNLYQYSFYYSDSRLIGQLGEGYYLDFFTTDGFYIQIGTSIYKYNIHTASGTIIGDTGGLQFVGFNNDGFIVLDDGSGIGEITPYFYYTDIGFASNGEKFNYNYISELDLTQSDLTIVDNGSLVWNGAGPSFTGGVLSFSNLVNREIQLATYNSNGLNIKNDYLFGGVGSGTVFSINYIDAAHQYLIGGNTYSFTVSANYEWYKLKTIVNELNNYILPDLFNYYTSDACSMGYDTTIIYENTDIGSLYYCQEIDTTITTTTTTTIDWQSSGGNLVINDGINGLYGTGVLQFTIDVGTVKVNTGATSQELEDNCKVMFDSSGNFLYLNNINKTKFNFIDNINDNNLLGERWNLELFGINLIGWLYDFLNWLAVQVLNILQVIINGLFNIFGDYIAVFQVPERNANYCFLGSNMFLQDNIKSYYSYSDSKTIVINGQSRLDYILILVIIGFMFSYFIRKS